ncbi:diacylglycerol kinase [Streptohalobacillus salinus]|uniref:Diacylglycerol kinase n=1 Tax=Streptohalobacillus salinus TaxID=621096 RepID=A0A2V3WD21_9BACI|nr:diacylglycerol kinase [Streptohalobacillus salinus]PXW91028.1 diacylglycerol kinase [Streptohalobacillus salinus]
MKTARIIYNPTSGREGFKNKLADVLARFEQAGYVTSAHQTTAKGNAIIAAKQACEARFDLIIAVGGDGTINEVVSGMAEQAYRPALGIIPAGTTNDFARALKIPRTVDKAVTSIINGRMEKLDIGKVNNHYFINIAGGGKLTEVSYEVPSKLKTVLGQLAYVMKGAEMVPRLRPIHTTIAYDGEVFEGEIMLFLIANSNSVGGFEKLAPDATMNDGLFDLFVLKKTNFAEFIRVITAALRGQHLHDKNVFHVKAKDIRVTTDETMQLNVDGEFGGLLPGHFTNLPQHITYILPTNEQEEADEQAAALEAIAFPDDLTAPKKTDEE